MPADPKRHATDQELLNAAIPIPDDDLEELAEPEVIDEGDDLDELAPLEVSGLESRSAEMDTASTKILQFGGARKPHDEHWKRKPNATGTGAIHVKTFVTKLRLDAVEHLDQQVNEWLDAHPEYEVKFVTTTIGTLVGKNTEEALFMNVWV